MFRLIQAIFRLNFKKCNETQENLSLYYVSHRIRDINVLLKQDIEATFFTVAPRKIFVS